MPIGGLFVVYDTTFRIILQAIFQGSGIRGQGWVFQGLGFRVQRPEIPRNAREMPFPPFFLDKSASDLYNSYVRAFTDP
jgi:hypothetical protein